jgi:hypothetical protein
MAIAHPTAAVPRAKARSHGSPGVVAVTLLVSMSLVVGVTLLYALWKFWPTDEVLASTAPQQVSLFGIHREVEPDVRLFVVVALAGALGGLMHSTRSLAWYIGHQGLRWRWVPYYLITFVVGAGLASIFYVVLRGGILGTKATTADANPYGFVAIAALVGLFSEQALEMLRRVANQVFASAPQGADTVSASTTTTTSASTTEISSTSTVVSDGLAARTGVASNVTASTATLEGDLTPAGPQSSYYFDYGTTTAYGQTTHAQVADATSADVHATADVNGLSMGTEYHFRLVVADAGGDWTTGDDATFTTNGG